MAEERLVEIESQLAHQEHTIGALNDALASQQLQVTSLEAQVKALVERVRALSQAGDGVGEDDAPPPHY